MAEGETPSEALAEAGLKNLPNSYEYQSDEAPTDSLQKDAENKAQIDSELSRLAKEYGVQKSKLRILLSGGVKLEDLEPLISLRAEAITVSRGDSIDPATFAEVLMPYDQLLELYQMCREAEGDYWEGLADRIVEHALSTDNGDPKKMENWGHWAALERAMGLYKKIAERMFADEY